MLVWVGVSALGGLSALARVGLDGAISRCARSALPLGTLAVNLSGTFALGLLDGLGISGDGLLLGGTAALGSYTTFSTWMLESQRLAEDGELAMGGVNVAISLVAGAAVALLGRALGRAL